jgi:hypothetical protein
MSFPLRFAGLCLFAIELGALGGCCTTAQCLDRRSTPDRDRVKASEVRLDVVHNDRVSSPDRDRTDWKFIDLPEAGRLTAHLHWDNGKAKLELAIYDKLGLLIQEGRPWGTGGLRAMVVVEDPGRHYIRVRARGKRDESHYALRLKFQSEGGGKCKCHDCQPGEQRCLGNEAYIVCAKIGKQCNAWNEVHACPAGAPCRDGRCAGCTDECSLGSRQCASGGFQVCRRSESGCARWSAPSKCRRGRRCRGGRCVRPGTRVKPTPQPERSQTASGRIISIYEYRGRMTLHIEIGDNPEVKPGMKGYVIEAATGKALRDGWFKITRIAGRFAIATTKLTEIGKNRQVKIKLR